MLTTPKGLKEIIQTFGNIPAMAKDGIISPEEEATFLTIITLPFPMKLSWGDQMATKMKCNKVLAPTFLEVFNTIKNKNLQSKIQTYGGCYNFRSKRTSSKLSTHSWGIAIDLNVDTNRMGTVGNMDPELVKVFKDAGFVWGGDWIGAGCDPMHMQYALEY